MTHLLNPASAVPHLGPTWGTKWHQWGHNWRRYQWNGEKELQDTIEVNIKYKEFLGPLTSPLRQTMLAYSSNHPSSHVSGVCLATFKMKPGYFARIILKPQSPLWIPPVSRSQVFPDSLGDPPERRSWAGCRWRWFRVWAAWQSPLASEDSASCLLGQLPSCQLKVWRKLSKHVGWELKIFEEHNSID